MNKQMFSLSDMASDFRHGYGVPNTPTNRIMQFRLIEEEYTEFTDALAEWISKNGRTSPVNKDFHDVLKELCDLVYVLAQFAENEGIDLDHAIQLVHESNMSKLGEDGKPIRREDGKILKGPNYAPADVTSCLGLTVPQLSN